MTQSGVGIDSDIKRMFDDIKIQRPNQKKKKYFTLKLDDAMKNIVIEKEEDVHPEGDEFQKFTGEMIEAEKLGECRYTVYDYYFTTKTGASSSKLFLIFWASDNCSIKQKMVYASSFSKLKSHLADGFVTMEAHDIQELSEASFEEKLK